MQPVNMEIPLSPNSNDANTTFTDANTALPPDDYSFYLSLIQDALGEDDTLHSILFQASGGNNRNSNSNIVSGQEIGGSDATDGSSALAHSGSVRDQSSPSPRHVTSSLSMLEQERVERQQEPTLSKANHIEENADMTFYLRDPNDDEDKSEGIRSKRAKISPAAVAAPKLRSRLWVRQRFHSWWDRCNSPGIPEAAFHKAFRMSRATFHMICDELTPVVAREDTVCRAAIPVSRRVAACIWRLATGDPLNSVSERFGLGNSTCHKVVPDVCAAIQSVLSPKFLKWPSDAALEEIKGQFESLSGIPNVVGSMHTTHIPILAPRRASTSVAAYLNQRQSQRRKKISYTITVQGVVGPDGVFTDLCIGWPGSMADNEVLEKSALHRRAMCESLKGDWIVGGAGYPLMDWLLVPYAHQNLTGTQQVFDEKVRELLRVARDAFVRLKSRWRFMLKGSKVKPEELYGVLGACCVLHNICEMRKEEMDPELRVDLEDDEIVPDNSVRSESAAQDRDMIAHKLFHHDLAGTAFFQLSPGSTGTLEIIPLCCKLASH